MSHHLVYVRTSPASLPRARSDKQYALRLADETPATPEEPHRLTNLGIPHGFADRIWYVLAPEKLRLDPHGNAPGDDLIGQLMVGYQVLSFEIDTGYGRPHYLEPARVREASSHLETVSLDDFERRADALGVAGFPELLADRAAVLEYYAQLRWFYRNAAEHEQAVIVTPM